MSMKMDLQVEHHLWSVTLRLMMRVESCIFSKMRKEGFVSVKLFIVGRRLDWGILHAVAPRVSKRLCTRSRTWLDTGADWMVVSCQRDSILMSVIWSTRKYRPLNVMVEEYYVGWQNDMRNHYIY